MRILVGVLRLMGQSWHGHRDVAIIWQDEGTRYVLHNLTCVNVATNTIRIGEIKSRKKRLINEEVTLMIVFQDYV